MSLRLALYYTYDNSPWINPSGLIRAENRNDAERTRFTFSDAKSFR